MYIPGDGGVSVGILQSDQVRTGGTPHVSIRVADMDSMLAKAEEFGGKLWCRKPKLAMAHLLSSPRLMET